MSLVKTRYKRLTFGMLGLWSREICICLAKHLIILLSVWLLVWLWCLTHWRRSLLGRLNSFYLLTYLLAVPHFCLQIVTAYIELRKVLFLAPSVCGFFVCMKYLRNRWTDLRQIRTENMFGPSLGRVWRSRSKVKGQGHQGKKRHFRPFQWSVCGLSLVRHF